MRTVSVVVPVYKTPLKLFEGCLNSLTLQTADDTVIEIIIVFDGSPAAELRQVVEKYKSEHAIVAIEIPQSGVSAARNAGIDAAMGDWILFVDADDQMPIGSVDALLAFATLHDCDLVLGDHAKIYENGRTELCVYAENDILPSDDFTETIRHDILRPATTAGSSWAKLYRNARGSRTIPRFDERLAVGEDTEYAFRYACSVNRIGYLHKSVYLYYRNTDSVVNAFRHDYASRICLSMDVMHKTIDRTRLSASFEEDYQNYVLFHLLLIMVHYLFNPNAPWTSKDRRKNYYEIADNPVFKKALSYWKYSNFTVTRNAALFTLKHRLYYLSKLIGEVRQRQLGNKKA